MYEPNDLVEVSSAEVTPFSSHQGEQVSVRRTIPVRTSQLRLCLRMSMRDKAWESALSLKKRKIYVWLISHSKRRETCCDVLTQTEIEQETHSARERTLTEHQEVWDHLKLRVGTTAEGGEAALITS